MELNLPCIFIVEFQHEVRDRIVGIEGLGKLLADEWQLEAEIIVVRSTQILHQCGYGDTVGIVRVTMSVNGEIDHCEKRVCVDTLVLTHFLDGFIAKAQIDAKRTEALKDVVIVSDDGDQQVVSLIHFLIFHCARTLLKHLRCKITKKKRHTQ